MLFDFCKAFELTVVIVIIYKYDFFICNVNIFITIVAKEVLKFREKSYNGKCERATPQITMPKGAL